MKLPLIVFGFLLLCILTQVKSDISFENSVECDDKLETETTTSDIVGTTDTMTSDVVATTHTMTSDVESTTDETVDEIRTVPSPTDGRPRPDQKSLLIVFDATASMNRDLEQLRGAAQEIVQMLAKQEQNPIYNYILSVFRDPGGLI